MWMPVGKRRLFAMETFQLPLLDAITREETELATKARTELLELIFDEFLASDFVKGDILANSRWKRARQLWKIMLAERRASYFLDLENSCYLYWIKSGEVTLLPCPTAMVEDGKKKLPKMQGSKEYVEQAEVVRATFLKCAEDYEQKLIQGKASEEKTSKLGMFRHIVQNGVDPDWFLKNKPKVFSRYEKFFANLVGSNLRVGNCMAEALEPGRCE